MYALLSEQGCDPEGGPTDLRKTFPSEALNETALFSSLVERWSVVVCDWRSTALSTLRHAFLVKENTAQLRRALEVNFKNYFNSITHKAFYKILAIPFFSNPKGPLYYLMCSSLPFRYFCCFKNILRIGKSWKKSCQKVLKHTGTWKFLWKVHNEVALFLLNNDFRKVTSLCLYYPPFSDIVWF